MNPKPPISFDRVVAELFRRQSDAVEAGPDSAELRKQLVSAIDDALAANAPNTRRASGGRVLPWVLLAAAAIALLVVGALQLKDRMSPEQSREGVTVDPSEVAVAGGGKLVKSPSARVDVTDNGTVATLRMGEVAAQVFEQELRIDTTDAQIYVRQASVTLETGAGCDGRVKLIVKEGTARVRVLDRDETVRAGEVWPRCAAATSDAPTEENTTGTPSPKKVPIVVKKELSLDEQNDLFERALVLQRGGDMQAAVILLERIVTEAPDSSLAEPALAQELRWLAPERSEQALVIARRYLKKFPMGSARADAEKLVAPAPAPKK